MSRKLKILAAAAGCMMAAGLTQPSASGASPFDHVVGGGQNSPNAPNPVAHFQINAKSGPNGENAQGKFSFKRTSDGPPTEQFTATITCLRVVGNRAAVVGLVDRTKDDPFPAGRYYLVRIQDMGQGNSSQDEIQNGVYTGDPYNCPSPTFNSITPITSGNLNVFDAS